MSNRQRDYDKRIKELTAQLNKHLDKCKALREKIDEYKTKKEALEMEELMRMIKSNGVSVADVKTLVTETDFGFKKKSGNQKPEEQKPEIKPEPKKQEENKNDKPEENNNQQKAV